MHFFLQKRHNNRDHSNLKSFEMVFSRNHLPLTLLRCSKFFFSRLDLKVQLPLYTESRAVCGV